MLAPNDPARGPEGLAARACDSPSDSPSALGGAAAALPEETMPIAVPAVSARVAVSRGSLLEIALVVLVAVFVALGLKVYVAEAYEIKGRSMEPTFHEEQRVMLLKVGYGIERGDIIIFASSEHPQKDLIKRVIGLPGDEINIEDGVAFVNGERIEEPYLDRALMPRIHEHRDRKVPPGKYYVLGDNRRDSQDSRSFDCIDEASVKGKVILRWWPLGTKGSF